MVDEGPGNVVVKRINSDTLYVRCHGEIEHDGDTMIFDMAREVPKGDPNYEFYEKRLPPE